MFRFLFITPIEKITEYTNTYSFFTGINIYTGVGVHGIFIAILGFGIMMEYINNG